jgi:hypothetical protein
MAREPRDIGASVRARLLDRDRTAKADFQILLTRYALERLLYRLSVSGLRERFVLKGAMLFAIWRDDPLRPTRDLDLLGSGDSDPATIAARGGRASAPSAQSPCLTMGLSSTWRASRPHQSATTLNMPGCA